MRKKIKTFVRKVVIFATTDCAHQTTRDFFNTLKEIHF